MWPGLESQWWQRGRETAVERHWRQEGPWGDFSDGSGQSGSGLADVDEKITFMSS